MQVIVIKGSPAEKWEEVQAIQDKPFVYIQSCGSKWAGQEPDDVEDLLYILKTQPLHPRFERYGDFWTDNPRAGIGKLGLIPGTPLYRVPVTRFYGNFWEYSYVFNIDASDPHIVRMLKEAITFNRGTPAYHKARAAEFATPRQ